MFGKSKISPEVKQYAKKRGQADALYSKYKKTGNKRTLEKAKYNYNCADALMAEIQAPKFQQTKVEIGSRNQTTKTTKTTVKVPIRAKYSKTKNYY